MLTVFCYVTAHHFVGPEFTGWLLVLPILLDLALVGRVLGDSPGSEKGEQP